jgi:hypothetical protein
MARDHLVAPDPFRLALSASIERLEASLLDRLAGQWIALGGQLVGRPDDEPVDIEALIVATAAIGEREPRIAEVAESWRATHPEAVNSFRLRSVAAEMATDLAAAADDPGRPTVQAARDLLRPVDLRRPGLLLWRLRAAFGLNVRADIVAHLAVRRPGWISIAELAGTVRFTKRNVAGAVASLRLAGLVESDRFIGADRVRLADDRDLRTWLGVAPGDVRVVDQVTLYGATLAALRLERETRATADVVALLEARALAERIGPDLRSADLPAPDVTVAGPDFRGAYDAWLVDLAAQVAPRQSA